jgi:predicted N-acetyltransferase YhbS
MTRIAIGDDPAILLGPLAVAPGLAGQGIGRSLMRTAMDAAQAAGESLVLLVGDPPYYAPFGFRTVQPYGRITLPGPVDPARLMLAGLMPGAWEAAKGMARRVVA